MDLHEPKLFLWYASAVFRPGATPPPHPQSKRSPRSAPHEAPLTPEHSFPPDSWHDSDLDLFLAESRRTVDQQQADKRDIRSRAQVLLTTALVLGSAIVADLSSRRCLPWWAVLTYIAALVFVLAAILAAAGLLTAQSPIGVPSMKYLESRTGDGRLKREAALGYSRTRDTGAGTVAVLVTVLRSSTLVLVIGFVLAATAHFLP